MVVDADGCTQVATAAVGDIPPGDVIVTSTTDALCFGDANGTATASISGTGTAPYHYEWFNASNISQGQDSITATGLTAGDYYVTITDANGCVATQSNIDYLYFSNSPIADFYADPDSTVSYYEPTIGLVNTSLDATTYEWFINGSTYSTNENTLYTNPTGLPGSYSVTLVLSFTRT